MSEARELMERMTKAFVAKDLDAVGACYAVDAVGFAPDTGEIKGREEIVAYLRSFLTAFPDARFDLVARYEDGPVAIDEGFMVGTNTGELEAPDGTTLPPTGASVRMRECDVLVVEHGVATAHRFYYDQLDLLTQLGLAPGQAGD
jgi:ketosteroid isomerase-like protein